MLPRTKPVCFERKQSCLVLKEYSSLAENNFVYVQKKVSDQKKLLCLLRKSLPAQKKITPAQKNIILTLRKNNVSAQKKMLSSLRGKLFRLLRRKSMPAQKKILVCLKKYPSLLSAYVEEKRVRKN